MKTYCFCPTSQPHWLKVAIKLFKNNIAEPIIWLGDDIHYDKAKDIFGENVFQMLQFVHRPYTLKEINFKGQHIDFFQSKNYFKAKDKCLKMMDRLDLYGSFSRIDREVYFHNLIIWFLSRLDEKKPDFFLSVENPHSHAQYLLYEICNYLKIPCYKFNNWPFVPLLFLENIDTKRRVLRPDNYQSTNFDKKIIPRINNFVDSVLTKEDNHEMFYMKDQREENSILIKISSFITKGIIEEYKDIKHNIGLRLFKKQSPINPYEFSYFQRSKIKYRRKKSLKKNYNLEKSLINYSKKYVYFPLHFEPERTTNPDGNDFHDQFKVITQLRKLIPDDILLVVKEHPSQFNLAERGSRGRSQLFYKLLKNISNLKITSIDENSIKLIKNAEFVSTITGTVALESALLGKRALTFGDTWYRDCPNITEFDYKINYEKFMSNDIASSDKVASFLITLNNKYSFPGYMNGIHKKSFKNFHELEFEKFQTQNVYSVLANFFKQNKFLNIKE